MKQTLLIILTTILVNNLYAQTTCRIKYDYDNAGQRVKRSYYCTSDGPTNPNTDVRISVFPNPTPGPIKVFTDRTANYMSVRVVNMSGGLIASGSCDECNLKTLDISSVVPGPYIVNVLFRITGMSDINKSVTIVKTD